jgi:hypothetical protein
MIRRNAGFAKSFWVCKQLERAGFLAKATDGELILFAESQGNKWPGEEKCFRKPANWLTQASFTPLWFDSPGRNNKLK